MFFIGSFAFRTGPNWAELGLIGGLIELNPGQSCKFCLQSLFKRSGNYGGLQMRVRDGCGAVQGAVA